jgi:anthranilate/para-aminobenzoate synthase component I
MAGEPWERFVRESRGAEVAGYFERPGDAQAGEAVWFRAADEHLVLTSKGDPQSLSRSAARFLEKHPRGGVVGYLSFDAVGLFEPALRRFPAGSPFPLGELAFVPALERGRVPRRRRTPIARADVGPPLADSLPRGRYQRAVRTLIEAIRAGEAFQVVLAHRRQWRRPADLLERVGRLRDSERFSSFYYLRFGDRELVGAAPESVCEVDRSRAYVDPIAGTIPRGPRHGRQPLRRDPKELCEHRMLVDLARNDLGRIARPGSVRLDWTERTVRYAHVDHLVSRVEAVSRPGTVPWDVLGATFPAGTVCGAPKIRAIELLREQEGSWRGPYAGAVALLRAHGRATFALTIRSAFTASDRLYTAAGAGIVHRSDPRREFDETLAKLSVVESALLSGGR